MAQEKKWLDVGGNLDSFVDSGSASILYHRDTDN